MRSEATRLPQGSRLGVKLIRSSLAALWSKFLAPSGQPLQYPMGTDSFGSGRGPSRGRAAWVVAGSVVYLASSSVRAFLFCPRNVRSVTTEWSGSWIVSQSVRVEYVLLLPSPSEARHPCLALARITIMVCNKSSRRRVLLISQSDKSVSQSSQGRAPRD